MLVSLRTLTIITALSLFACGGNDGARAEVPVPDTTQSVTPAPDVPLRTDEPVAPPAPTEPTPPVTSVAPPERDLVRTEDKPVIKERELPEPVAPKAPTPPMPIDPDPAPASAPTPPAPEVEEAPVNITPGSPDHQAWDDLLKLYVDRRGRVNYNRLKSNEAALDSYLATLAQATPTADWTRNEGLAYWINAYNAFTFKLILNNYPVASITDLDGGDPWKVKWIKLGDKTYSLNNIEHDIIRPKYQDPRIHFAVVCAAMSCPPLLNRAFRPGSLDEQLDRVTRSFINNSLFNSVTGDVKVSKIFDWYQEDFGDVKAYLNKYLEQPIPQDQELGYKAYDWSLNKL